MNHINEEDVKFIKKAIEISNKGYYMSGGLLTQVYNRVFNKNLPSTNCSSCIRHRISELARALKRQEAQEAQELENKAQETSKENEVVNTPQGEKEVNTEQINEENKDANKQKSYKTKGRKKKSE